MISAHYRQRPRNICTEHCFAKNSVRKFSENFSKGRVFQVRFGNRLQTVIFVQLHVSHLSLRWVCHDFKPRLGFQKGWLCSKNLTAVAYSCLDITFFRERTHFYEATALLRIRLAE